jgi:PPOX class probable F420-dependent enzyme
MTAEEVQLFLEEERTGILASGGDSGYPHVVPMWYSPEGGGVSIWTYARSQKVLNLRRDPRASFLVEAGDTYADLRGVSIDAGVTVLDDYDSVLALGLRLHNRYSGLAAAGDEPPPELVAQAHKRVGLILKPVRHRSWDHRKLTP